MVLGPRQHLQESTALEANIGLPENIKGSQIESQISDNIAKLRSVDPVDK